MGKLDEILSILETIQFEVNELKDYVQNGKSSVPVPESDSSLKFPLCTAEELLKFESSLKNANNYNNYLIRFKEELQSIRFASTTYFRRKCLKELLFSRYI